MRRFLNYCCIAAGFAAVSSGALTAAFMDVCGVVGYRLLWLLVPMTLLFMAAVAVNSRYAVPRLLMRRRVGAYCAVAAAMAFAVSGSALLMEYAARSMLDLPLRIADPGSPWIALDTAANSVLALMIIAGLGVFSLYRQLKRETDYATALAARLRRYVAEVRTRLRPDYILGCLSRINSALGRNPAEAPGLIRSLAAYLREQLYDLPVPPVADTEELSPVTDSPAIGFIADPGRRMWRNLTFQALLAVICAGTFFTTPDRPEFSASRLASALAMLALLDTMAYANILWLYPRFRRHGRPRRYLRDVALLTAAMVVPLVTVQTLTYDLNPYTRDIPRLFMVISTLGSACTLLFFAAGVTAWLLLQDWISGSRRVALLHAETARQEYAFLRKQVNPHFLFNVLNNIGIVSAEDAAEARLMLAELERMLRYRLEGTDREHASLREEIAFINSYLTLEGTRIDGFTFAVTCRGDAASTMVPAMLFIPMAENAVKHSDRVDDVREVAVTFEVSDEGVRFECVNTCSGAPRRQEGPGGLGLANTRRRLELLYGDRFRMSAGRDGTTYRARLFIPTAGTVSDRPSTRQD